VRSRLGSLLLCCVVASPAMGHDLSPEQKINRLHIRIIGVDKSATTAFWIAIAGYATAAITSGAVGALYARRRGGDGRVWFLAGVIAPIVAMPAAVLLELKAEREIHVS